MLLEGQPSLAHMMETRDMKRFGKLLLELHSSRENPLQTRVLHRGERQARLTYFFKIDTSVPNNKPRVTLQEAEELRAKRRPK